MMTSKTLVSMWFWSRQSPSSQIQTLWVQRIVYTWPLRTKMKLSYIHVHSKTRPSWSRNFWSNSLILPIWVTIFVTNRRDLKGESLILLRGYRRHILITDRGLKRSGWRVKIIKNWCFLFVLCIKHHQSRRNRRLRSVFWLNIYHQRTRVREWSWLGCWGWNLMSSVRSQRNGSTLTKNWRYLLICRLASSLRKLCITRNFMISNWGVLNSSPNSRSKLKLYRSWCQSQKTRHATNATIRWSLKVKKSRQLHARNVNNTTISNA